MYDIIKIMDNFNVHFSVISAWTIKWTLYYSQAGPSA